MRVMAGPLTLRPDITILILALVVIAKGVTTNSSLGRRPSVGNLLITPFLATATVGSRRLRNSVVSIN